MPTYTNTQLEVELCNEVFQLRERVKELERLSHGRKTITRTRQVVAYLDDPRLRNPQNLICAAAMDAEQALVFWRLFTTRIAKDTVRLIPHSRAAWRFYRLAKRGEVELCSYIKAGGSMSAVDSEFC